MFNIPKRKIALVTVVIVIMEVLVLHVFFQKGGGKSKRVKAYRLLSDKDLEKVAPDVFIKVFPQFNENVTLHEDQDENITSVIHPSFAVPEMLVLFLITSVPDNFARRHLIRRTWANTWRGSLKNGKAARSLFTRREWPKLYCNSVFVVGLSDSEKYNRRVTQEASILGDIFRAQVEERYTNIADKVWKAFEWATSVKTKFVFKVEDGVYVNIPRMIHWLQTDKKLPTDLYGGHIVFRHPIDGEFDDQGIGEEGIIEGNNTKAQKLDLPKYCLGAFYIFSSNILPDLVKTAKETNKVQAGEDAYTGLVAQNTYIRPYHTHGLFVLDGSKGANAVELKEEQLKHSVCLGDKFTDDYLQQLHDRYIYIRKRIDGKV